jgi:hypothetical protein
LVICLRNDTACHWVVSRPPWINADFEKRISIKNFCRITIYFLNMFQGVLANLFRTIGAGILRKSYWSSKLAV